MVELQFDRIALSLSGGGFRAAAYGMGTLKTLHLLGLLENVHLLSTASGGTLAGLYYAQRRKANPALPFATIYQDFYKWLANDELLPSALARWEKKLSAKPPTPNYKLISAFADSYQQLYANATFNIFWQEDPENHPFHLQSVIFGATELYSGLTFRFQYSALFTAKQKTNNSYLIGNGNVSIAAHYARQLRLGDIAAASSCFPAGFEPLVLPDDFLPGRADASILRLGNPGGAGRTTRVALLDGGIYDNQGMESLLLANERNARHRQNPHLSPAQAKLLAPSTLYLVADVSGPKQGIYPAPGPGPGDDNSPTLPRLGTYLLGGVAALFALAALLARGDHPFWGGLLAGVTGTLAAVAGGLLYAGWKKLTAALAAAGDELPGWVLPRLGQLTLRQWVYLVKIRLTSTAAVLSTVFLRRIRSLNYEALYRRLDADAPSFQVVASVIGLLATEYARRKPANPTGSSVGDQLAAVYSIIEQAQAMPTTLWWQRQHRPKLPAIVSSAELTLCFQLLRRFEQKPAAAGTPGAEVHRRARLLWDAYQVGGTGFSVPVTALPVLENPACTVQELLTVT